MSNETAPKKKVLFVDDEPQLRPLFKRALEGAGYEVAVATNGVEGVRIGREFRPDGLLTDYSMPDMDGYVLARHMRDENPACRTVLYSGKPGDVYHDHPESQEELARYVDRFLTKPVRISEMLAAFKELLGEPESQ